MKFHRTAALVASLALAGTASAITIDADYDHASLESFSVAGAGGRPGTTTYVDLVGRDNYYGNGQWRWLNFTASDVLGDNVVFRISDNFAGGGSKLNNHAMVYSYDGVNWDYFDNNQRSNGTYSFSIDGGFTQDEVQVAYAFPYSYGMSVAHTQEVLASPWATPTLSGDANGVIGMSPGGTDDLGRTVDPREIFAYRITDPATDSGRQQKLKVMVMSGLHAGETLGTHTYQGLIDFLISDDPVAAHLRQAAEFIAYPCANPDGRFAGNSRTTVENVGTDPNRLWHPDLYATHQDIRVQAEAMYLDITQTSADLSYFIDFHSTVPTGGDDFGFIPFDQGDHLSPFWQSLLAIQPNIQSSNSTGTSWYTTNHAEAFLGAEVDVTFETQFGFQRPLDYYHDMGRNFGLAFADSLGIPIDLIAGDANSDGVVDLVDLSILAANFDSFGTFEQGDFNVDGVVDLLDLSILAANFQPVSTPEPASFLLGLAALIAGTRQRVC
ncbi:M14 family zinc carboxypeptidase [Mucisphaera calidilacus]|uniref:Zinc carboxypeptidase n=1 Tax=Mucisphaera calidilacus TaxID=2527982 RepID=A0A518C0B9_9BACT|nr:M14 family zinc carboxypeptidase [Mucisphaera calidilacus]QDU72662.1 Zinc carboxypeptidase [Mucisphaera calidilacus]